MMIDVSDLEKFTQALTALEKNLIYLQPSSRPHARLSWRTAV